MKEETYIIPSNRILYYPFILGMAIVLPLMMYGFFMFVQQIAGVILLFVFWLIAVSGIWLNSLHKQFYCSVSIDTIKVVQKNRTIVMTRDDVLKIGFTTIVQKILGQWDGKPYLALSVSPQVFNKIGQLNLKKEMAFIKKGRDMGEYMGDKMDLYINMEFVAESDSGLAQLVQAFPQYKSTLSPLIKTSDASEYEKVLAENFSKKNI